MPDIAATTVPGQPQAVTREDLRQKTLEQLKTAIIIDLTNEEDLMDGANANSDGKFTETQKWESLAVCPVYLTLLEGGTKRHYTVKDDSWTGDDGSKARGIRPQCIIEVILKPWNGYPARFSVSSHNECFKGEYKGGRGTIPVDLRQMRAMIRRPFNKSGFISSVKFTE